MSNVFFCGWSALLLASLFALSHSGPIVEEATSNRCDEKQGGEISTTESHVTTVSGQFPANDTEGDHVVAVSSDETNSTSKIEMIQSPAVVPLIRSGAPQMEEESNKGNVKRDAYDGDDDDDSDDSDSDYDDDDKEERGEALLRTFAGVYERARRASSDGESEAESTTKAESEFVSHVLDYSLNRKKREQDEERVRSKPGEAFERKKRQSGETVPYISPNRSRREEELEPDAEEAQQSGTRMEEEEEEEEEEEKKEEIDEKLAMES